MIRGGYRLLRLLQWVMGVLVPPYRVGVAVTVGMNEGTNLLPVRGRRGGVVVMVVMSRVLLDRWGVLSDVEGKRRS